MFWSLITKPWPLISKPCVCPTRISHLSYEDAQLHQTASDAVMIPEISLLHLLAMINDLKSIEREHLESSVS